MFLAQFSHSKNNSINGQGDTKNESSIVFSTKKHDNFFNALKALGKPRVTPVKPVGSSRASYIGLNTLEGEISEYSKTNAHFSREEEYIMEKDIKIINNNVKKQYHKRAMTSANIPYRMNIQPMLAKIIEIKDEENDIEKPLDRLDGNVYTSRYEKKVVLVGSTACDSKKNKDDRLSNFEFNNSFIIKDDGRRFASLNEVIGMGLELGLENIKLNDPECDLGDLDEAKEIDILSYHYAPEVPKNDKKLNISTIDLSGLGMGNQKNSKILVVDSEILSNNSLLSINMAEKFLSKKKKKTQGKLNESDSLYNICDRAQNGNGIHKDSLDLIDRRFYNTTEKKELVISTTNKKMRQKYLKSELLFMRKHNSIDIMKGTEGRNGLLKASQKLETRNGDGNNTERRKMTMSQNISNGTFGVKKNLMSCFGEDYPRDPTPIWNAGHRDIDESLDGKLISILETQGNNQSQEFDLRTMELITDHTAENINATFNEVCKTPEDKIKKVYINALSHFKNNSYIQYDNINEINITNSFHDDPEESILNTVFDLDFINNLLSRESYYLPDHEYITRHPKLKPDYRSILLDWIMELCEEFAFKRDTFHYTVNYLDRFLSHARGVTKASLQLIGVSCLSMAAKFEVYHVLTY
jgi:hypothetical protein